MACGPRETLRSIAVEKPLGRSIHRQDVQVLIEGQTSVAELLEASAREPIHLVQRSDGCPTRSPRAAHFPERAADLGDFPDDFLSSDSIR
jgi:hypothetical protein